MLELLCLVIGLIVGFVIGSLFMHNQIEKETSDKSENSYPL